MNFTHNKIFLNTFYEKQGLFDNFDKDCQYLEKSFCEINKIWLDNLQQIEEVKFLMIAEAPLWGKVRKYIYNPKIKNSQFFFRSDLEDILNKHIADKKAFIKVCNDIGLLIVDISPFALNPTDTAINYRQMTTNQYKQLVQLTVPYFFEQKIIAIQAKRSDNLKAFFRYSRVKKTFQDIIGKVLIDHNIINEINQIGDISQNGGGIDKRKLKQMILS